MAHGASQLYDRRTSQSPASHESTPLQCIYIARLALLSPPPSPLLCLARSVRFRAAVLPEPSPADAHLDMLFPNALTDAEEAIEERAAPGVDCTAECGISTVPVPIPSPSSPRHRLRAHTLTPRDARSAKSLRLPTRSHRGGQRDESCGWVRRVFVLTSSSLTARPPFGERVAIEDGPLARPAVSSQWLA